MIAMAQARCRALNGGCVGKRGPGAGSSPVHLLLVELKHRILGAINKLSDRDTQQIAVDDLERIAQNLSPEGVPLFLGCLYETDSQQKSIARRECVRLFGTLALLHGNFLAPYLPKIISCIIRRLKDPDTIVRDVCVDAVGTIALNVDQESSTEDGMFEVMFRPLVEALNEQNKYVQIGAAMCLARLMESSSHPPLSSTQRLHPRILKLLKSSSFVAKAALLSVVGSLTQVEKAEADQLLASLLPHVQSSLQSSDWSIRKAAVETLARIATRRGPAFSRHRSSALTALELCRFDKVKPVRESALNAINLWKTLPISEMEFTALEPNTATKDTVRHANFKRTSQSTDSSNHSPSSRTQANEGRHSFRTQISTNSPVLRAEYASSTTVHGSTIDTPRGSSSKHRVSFGSNKIGNSLFFRRSEKRSLDDWPIEVVVPRGSPPPNLVSVEQESKNQRMEVYALDMRTDLENSVDEDPDICQLASIKEIVSMDQKNKPESAPNSKDSDKQGLSCLQFQNRSLMEPIESYSDEIKHTARMDENCWIDNASQVIISEEQSWDSPVALASPCSITDYESSKLVDNGNQLASIQRQLARLEEQQSTLLEMLQALMGNSHEGMQALESRLQGLERVVDDVTNITARFYGGTVEKVKVTMPSSNDADKTLHEGTEFLDVENEPVNEKREHQAASRIVASEAIYQQKNCVESCADNKNECTHNANTLEKHVKTVKGNLEVDKLGEKGDPKETSFSKIAQNPFARNIWKHCKDEVTLTAFPFDREKACSRLSVQDGCSVLELKPSTPKPNVGSTGGDKKKENVKVDVWDSWSRALEHLRTDNVNSAYMEVLASKDELLLVHLMARTGPVLDQLLKGTARQVLSTVTQLLCKQSVLDFALPWIQQITDMVKSNGLDYFDLSVEANSLIMRILQGASHMDSAEGLFGCGNINRLALQLRT